MHSGRMVRAMRTDIVLEDADHIWENLFLMLFGVGYSTADNSEVVLGHLILLCVLCSGSA